MIYGLLWKLRMGAPWRALPPRYGALQTSPLISKRATLNTVGMHYPILGYTFSIASSTAVQVAQMVERGAWDIFTALLAGLVACPVSAYAAGAAGHRYQRAAPTTLTVRLTKYR